MRVGFRAANLRYVMIILTIGDIGWAVALTLTCLAGVLMTMFRLPGTWLIVVIVAVYGWVDGWVRITGTTILLLLGIAVIAEALETAVSVLAVRRVGASRKAAIGGVVGGFVGMLVFSIPIPLIGTVLGALIGCFVGAMIGETLARRDLNLATKAGLVSAVGFAFGAMLKTAAAIAMSGIVLWAAIRPIAESNPAAITASEPAAQSITHSPDN